MRSFAKYLGASVGWSFGGPIGAIIGFVLGSVVDGLGDSNGSFEYNTGRTQQQNRPFRTL